ncbi:MAG: hypothetical protein ACLP1X_16590 [Polyangiaceae bacterium]|jgi:hypothetical protein
MTKDVVSHRVARFVTEFVVGALGAAAWLWALRADPAWCQRHVVIGHWALDDNAAVVARSWRIAAVLTGLALVAVARPALGRWVARVGLRKALVASGPTCAALILALVTSEAILEYTRSKRHDPTAALWTEARIGQPDPRYGWVWQPSRVTILRVVGRPVEYAINADHDRARSVDDVPDRSLPTILFTGESISVGHGLPWDQTFPAIVGQMLGVQVVNLGVHGYGSDQAFLRLADTLPRFDHPVAVVSLFMPCMMWRMTRVNHPRVALDDGSLTLIPAAKSWRDLAIGQLWLDVVRYDSDAVVTRAASLFRETARLAVARGAKALFVRPYFGKRDDAALVDELFTRQGIPCIGVDIGREVLPLDYHPDAKATRRMADAIVNLLSLGSSAVTK